MALKLILMVIMFLFFALSI